MAERDARAGGGELIPRAGIHEAAARGYEAGVEHYRRGRPTYPDDAVSYLMQQLHIGPASTVLELGAGTGRFTELMVHTGATITAIEPVAAMREALESACPTVTALDGTAEEIPIPDGSVDAVVAAQAFHWFDGDRALPEIHRVLRSAGRLGLIWNVRDETSDWSERLTAIFDRVAGADAPRYRDRAWRRAFERTELFGPLHRSLAWHAHAVTREGFLDRVLSVSYVASTSPEQRAQVLEDVNRLLDSDPELAGRDEILMPYRTDVFWCERR
ncbi:MAG TPA: class I SAM-dependent methyltransferase [Actinomycetota bacterium]|nr:class I SAM-dependent methyltransferase [Actinomycetota bacterium]